MSADRSFVSSSVCASAVGPVTTIEVFKQAGGLARAFDAFIIGEVVILRHIIKGDDWRAFRVSRVKADIPAAFGTQLVNMKRKALGDFKAVALFFKTGGAEMILDVRPFCVMTSDEPACFPCRCGNALPAQGQFGSAEFFDGIIQLMHLKRFEAFKLQNGGVILQVLARHFF